MSKTGQSTTKKSVLNPDTAVRKSDTPLNPRQERFCQEYLKDLCATQAAIRAGYSERSANRIATRVLSLVHIRARIAKLKAARTERTEITIDRVITELAKVGLANPEEFSGTWPGIRFDMRDKVRALELLGKHVGAFPEKGSLELSVAGHLGILAPPIGESPEQWAARVERAQQARIGHREPDAG